MFNRVFNRKVKRELKLSVGQRAKGASLKRCARNCKVGESLQLFHECFFEYEH